MPLFPRYDTVFLGLVLGLISLNALAENPTSATGKGAFLGAKPTEYPDWFKQSFLELEADVEDAVENGKRVILLFHQDGCPYCNALVERNLSQKDIETTLREHFEVIAINIWGDREVLTIDGRAFSEKQFAAAMKVQFTPSLVFLNEKGGQLLRLNGYLPPGRFKMALDYVVLRLGAKGSFRDYVASRQGKSGSGGKSLNKQEFFVAGEADLRGLAADRVIAVFFEQRDCLSCDKLHQGPLQDPGVRHTAGQLHCVQLDMWSGQLVTLPDGTRMTARELAKKLHVQYAPTIVLLDNLGREIIRNEAEFKTFHTHGIFEYARSGGYREQPSFQRWLEARADHLREQGIDVDLWR